MTTTLINAGTARFLSEVMTDLPHNCVFQKVLTGSGGTTVALTNTENYVICVPFKALIESKVSQHGHVLGVKGGTKDVEIQAYVSSVGVKKIMVTYDSLPRLIKFINPQDYRLLVDEAHKLIDSGSFRSNAIDGVLENYTLFKSYTFMTATPVKDKYQHPAIAHLHKAVMKWSDIKPVNVSYKMLESDFTTKIASLAVDYINGTLKGNPYFFINSVKSITEIIKKLVKAGYTDPNLFKIVIADNDDNKAKIKKDLGAKFIIESVNTPNKKITFLTATAFEGCDIYDEDGVTYILTDGRKDHTKIDVLTLLPQIIGRIRNSKLKEYVNVIFTPSPYFSHITEDEFEAYVKGQLEEAKGYIEVYNSTNNMQVKTALYAQAKVNSFIINTEDSLKLNETAWYSEMHNFESLHTTYYVRKVDGVLKERADSFKVEINDIPYNYQPSTIDPQATLADKVKLETNPSFRTILKDYCEDRDNNVISNLVLTVEADKEYEMIVEAYEVLGSDKCKALEYRKAEIEKALTIVNKQLHYTAKIVRLLDLRVGEWISAADLKVKIQSVYDQLDIDKKAKATDITEWYGVKEQCKRVSGDNKKGYAIITAAVKK